MNQSIKTAYDSAAETYRLQYDGIPPWSEDVDLALRYVEGENPMVLEIGCAYGREANEILTRTNRYIGIDISSEYIKMARQEVFGGLFEVADVMTYDFPGGLDVVFAFASLLHNPKEDLRVVLERVSNALNPGGVIFISLKRHEQYETGVLDDGYTRRRYYYYTHNTVLDVTPDTLTEVYYDEQSRQEQWFTMILQKK